MIEKIDHVRQLRGMTTEDLEGAARLGRNYLSNRFSRGTDPKAEHLLQIAQALDVSIEWLLDETTDGDPPPHDRYIVLKEWERYLIDALRSADMTYADVMRRLMLAPWTQTIPDPDHPGLQEIRDKVAGRDASPDSKRTNAS